MKKMILLIPVLGLFFSCKKDVVVEPVSLDGKWNLVETRLYENDSLTALAEKVDASTVYYFYDEQAVDHAGEMYIEEDGEQQFYDYLYDRERAVVTLDSAYIFSVDYLSGDQLQLSRTYGHYRSAYTFEKEF